MKNIVISGGVTRDAKLNSTQSGSVLNFSVAVDHREGRDKTTMYFDCALWGKRGEALERFITKGSRVSVAGDLSTREHDGKTYLRVNASDVSLLGGGQQDGQRQQDSGNRYQSGYDAQKPQGGAQAGGGYNLDMPDDSDIPF